MKRAATRLGATITAFASAGMSTERSTFITTVRVAEVEGSSVPNSQSGLVKVPWRRRTKVKHDLAGAEKVLNEDHYGLEKIKTIGDAYMAVAGVPVASGDHAPRAARFGGGEAEARRFRAGVRHAPGRQRRGRDE